MSKNPGDTAHDAAKIGSPQELALPQMPQVHELPLGSEQIVQQVFDDFCGRARAGSLFNIKRTTDTTNGRQLGVVNGRLVYFNEREPDIVGYEYLLTGLIAARQSQPAVANPERYEMAGLDLMLRVEQALTSAGIDLSLADEGATINLERVLPEQLQHAYAILHEQLVAAAASGPTLVHWLRQGGVTRSTGQRSLKADVMGLEVDAVSGSVRIQRNPHKTVSVIGAEQPYRIEPRDRHVAGLIARQRAGSKLSEEEVRTVTSYQRAVAGAQHVLQIELHRAFGLVGPEGIRGSQVAALEARFAQTPGIFADPFDTLQFQQELEQIRMGAITSGAWLYFDEEIRSAIHGPDTFARALSMYEPRQAQAMVLALLDRSERCAAAAVADFAWTTDSSPARHREARTERMGATGTERTRGPRQVELLGIPSEVLPSSLLGVAHALGLVQAGKVYEAGTQPHPADSVVVYGTTDVANPAELIMTAYAASAGGTEAAEAIYFADSCAHSVGSYLRRILIPTVVALSGMDAEAAERMLQRAGHFDDTFDTPLEQLKSTLRNANFSAYIDALTGIVGPQTTFTKLYDALNRRLATQLGVRYVNAQDLLMQSQLTVGQLRAHIEHMGESAEAAYDRLARHLLAQGVPEDRTEGMMQNLFGMRGAWGAESRHFLRRNSGNEAKVDITRLDPNTRLSDLAAMGLTLGGNAWGVVMMVANFGHVHTVAGDKNTRLGGNYAASVIGIPHGRIAVSPVVRVVPDGNGASTGDGLDIGAYVLHPQLIGVVHQAHSDPDHKVRGGQSRVIVQVVSQWVWLRGQRVLARAIRYGHQPMNEGRMTTQQTTPL